MTLSPGRTAARRTSPLDWVPFSLVVLGVAAFFYLDLALPAPVSLAEKEGSFALWGTFWTAGYLVLFLRLRRRGPGPDLLDSGPRRPEPMVWGPAVASAALLAVGYLLLFGYVFLTSGGCLARGTCPLPTTVSWTFGLLTPFELVELVLVLTVVGILLLVFATWQNERRTEERSES